MTCTLGLCIGSEILTRLDAPGLANGPIQRHTRRPRQLSRFFVQQTRIGFSVHTGRYGAYQTLFCDPLVRALKSAYLPGYRCTLSAGTMENILRRPIPAEESIREDGLAVDLARDPACDFC